MAVPKLLRPSAINTKWNRFKCSFFELVVIAKEVLSKKYFVNYD